MQVLTPSGYVDIIDLNIGDDVIAYDISTGAQIINHLEGKTLWTPEMYPAEYTVGHYDEDGNYVDPVLIYTSYEVFQRIHGDWVFYRINDTWDLFKQQSVWANMNVVHASDLQIGDILYNDLDGDVTITSIEEVELPSWWKLDVSGDSSYIADGLTLHNASRYWVGGGSSTNWNATVNTNWSASSGGANNASVPTSADVANFDGLGNSNAVISAITTIGGLIITSAYTATITHNAELTIAGSVTLGANYTIAGTSGITISAVCTFTSNGKTWPNAINFTIAATTTLVGNCIVGGLVNFSANTAINKTVAETFTMLGGLAFGNNMLVNGTADLVAAGGDFSTVGSGGVQSNLIIAGNITINGVLYFWNKTLTYVSGTVTGTGTFNINGTVTLDLNNVFINIGTLALSATATLVSSFSCKNLTAGGANINTSTAKTLTVTNSVTAGNNGLGGSAELIVTGGTIATSNNVYSIYCPLTINGNVTFTGNVLYYASPYGGLKTLKYLSGTTNASTTTVYINNSCSFDTSGISWGGLTFVVATTMTLVSNLNVSGLVTISANTVVNKTTTETLTLSGGIFLNTKNISGTADIYLTGGTWSTGSYGVMVNNLFINGNVSITGTSYFDSKTITYISGVVTTTGNNMVISGGVTLNTNGIVWNILSFSTGIYTLTSNLTVNGLFTGSGTFNKTTSEVINANGGITNGAILGTAVINFTGGTWTALTGNGIASPLNINGNIVISGTVYPVGTLTYVSGTITGVSTPVLNLSNVTQTLTFDAGTNMTVPMTFSGGTKTLLGNFSTGGLVSITVTTIINKTTTETFSLSGGITHSNNIYLQGTTKLIASGGDFASAAGGGVQTDMEIAGNITINSNLTFNGTTLKTLTYVSGTVTGAGTLSINGALALNLNGVTIPNISMGATSILTSNLTCNTFVTSGGATINKTTTQTVTVNGNITIGNNGVSGTAEIIAKGGIVTTGSNSFIANSFTLDGNLTFAGSILYIECRSNPILKYLSGTNNCSTTDLKLTGGGTASFDTSGVSWKSLQLSTSFTPTFILISNLNVVGATTVSAACNINTSTSARLITGGLVVTTAIGGTATIELAGGTWSGTNTTGISNNLDINGDVTLSGIVYYKTGILKYNSGTVTQTGSILKFSGNSTLHSNGLTWNSIDYVNMGGVTVTLITDLNISGTFTPTGFAAITFNKTTNESVNMYNGISVSGGSMLGTATFNLRGGTWSGGNNLSCVLNLIGDITISGTIGLLGGTLNYISGNINTAGSTFQIANHATCTLNTAGIIWNNVTTPGNTASTTFVSDFVARNIVLGSASHTFNTSTGARIIPLENLTLANTFPWAGNATLLLGSGVVVNFANSNISTLPITIDGDCTIMNTLTTGANTMTYVKGRVNFINFVHNVTDNANFRGFGRLPVPKVIITVGKTVTMDQFFTGTPTTPASIVATTAVGQYTVAFTDSFERVATNVITSGCVLARPMQLIISSIPKINTIRTTNSGIRYGNQSPNGFSKNTPTVTGLSTGPALGLLSDPCFIKQS